MDVQIYEVDGADPSTKPAFEKKWKMFDALPRDIVAIRKFLAARKAWYPLPRDDQGLLDLGLPLNMDANTGVSWTRSLRVCNMTTDSDSVLSGTTRQGQGCAVPVGLRWDRPRSALLHQATQECYRVLGLVDVGFKHLETVCRRRLESKPSGLRRGRRVVPTSCAGSDGRYQQRRVVHPKAA